MLLILILSICLHSTIALKCYSCASIEYKPLFEKNTELSKNVRLIALEGTCDSEESVQSMAPVESCHSTCITIFEPHYFGGLQSLQRPHLFIRGCADKILSSMASRPREVDFLQRAKICVSLQLSEIYPRVMANEIVEVCSCTENGCNYRTSLVNHAISLRLFTLFSLIFLLIY